MATGKTAGSAKKSTSSAKKSTSAKSTAKSGAKKISKYRGQDYVKISKFFLGKIGEKRGDKTMQNTVIY